MLIFETERLIIRQYTEEDKDLIFLMTGNYEVMRYIRPVMNKEESDKFLLENIAAYQQNPPRGRWPAFVKNTGEFVGSFAIIPIPDDKEKIQLGYTFLPQHWGKGYASEVTKKGLDYFFTMDTLSEIYAITETGNLASQKVLLKAGFQPFGTKMEDGIELRVFIFRRDDYVFPNMPV